MFEHTKRFCDSLLGLGVPGFDLAVYQDGKCLLRYMNGYSDLENRVKMSGSERYNIYSCSKLITCVAALQLWEKGLFSLDDKLSDYMPEFSNMAVDTGNGIKEAENPILIKHLFEMTAGFSYRCTSSPELCQAVVETGGRCSTIETMRYLARSPLLFEPGDRWEYSLCHDVLAALIEVIVGQPFYEYVRQNIFVPLGMNDSTFMLPEKELHTVAEQYLFENGEIKNIGKNIFKFKFGREYASGGAGCISTVDDYIKFLEELRVGNKILKRETIDFMVTDRLTEYQKRTYSLKDTYGYGLGCRCPKYDKKYVDFGWGGAACAYLAVDIQNKISLYFGTHVLASPAQEVRSILYQFVLAELTDNGELDNVYSNLKKIHNHNLTY